MRTARFQKQSRLGSGTAYEPYIWLAIGTGVVLLLMYLSLPTRAVFGIDLIWPFAGLVAAIGWGMSPISITAVVLLALFGVLQDLQSNAPVGSWAVVHLAAYSLMTVFRSQEDGLPIAGSRTIRLFSALLLSYLLLGWLGFASSGAGLIDGGLLGSIAITGAAYLLFRNIFLLESGA